MRTLFLAFMAIITTFYTKGYYIANADTNDGLNEVEQLQKVVEKNEKIKDTILNSEIITIPASETGIKETVDDVLKNNGLDLQNLNNGNNNDITKSNEVNKLADDRLTDKQISNFRKELSNYDEVYSKNVKVGNINGKNSGKKIDIKVKSAKDSKEGLSSIDVRNAYDCFMDRQYELAVLYYKSALKNNPKNNEAKFGLATAYYMLMQYDQAIDIYSDLIIHNYAREKVVNNLLFALRHKSYKEALDILLDVNDNSKGYSDILAQIGLIYMQIDDINKALTALNRANELAPSNALVSYNLGIAYDKQNNYDYAKHFYEQALRNDINEIISSSDFKSLTKRIEQLNEIIKKEVDKIVKENKKNS